MMQTSRRPRRSLLYVNTSGKIPIEFFDFASQRTRLATLNKVPGSGFRLSQTRRRGILHVWLDVAGTGKSQTVGENFR